MPLCDLCGKEAKLTRTEIEKARLNVCPDCAKYGKKMYTDVDFSKQEDLDEQPARRQATARKPERAAFQTGLQEDQIAEGYGPLVRMARDRAKLTQGELGKAIAEKENTIQRIESGQQEPTLKIAKKLEQFLRISLITKLGPKEAVVLNDVDFSETDLTIGDLLDLSKDSSK